jgi:choline dehydrogenase-like flavoprotein
MDHHFGVGASGTMPGFSDKYHSGNRPNNTYIPRYQNINDRTRTNDFLRGFGTQGGAQRQNWARGIGQMGLGESLKHELREPGPWGVGYGAFGEMLPDYDNYVELDGEQVDQWGLPLLSIHCRFRENELAMQEAMANWTAEILEATGCVDVKPYNRGNPPGFGIHEMGTARMGRDPATSVLNGWNQCHECSNVFVTDGAAMTSSACQNPSITYMALTARAANHAVDLMKRNEL